MYGGSEFLYGDASFILNGNSNKELDPDTSSFTQKYINSNRYVNNITLGDISSQTLRPKNFRGIKLSNKVIQSNGEFNKLNINGFTFPLSRVEIYKNKQIEAVVFSDEQGYYTYELPIFYGSNIVDLKIYGPHGERDEISKVHQIKETLLKKEEFYYDLSAGQNTIDKNKYLTGDVKYGLKSNLTLRAGLSHIQSPSESNTTSEDELYTGIYGHYDGNIIYSSSYIIDKIFEGSLSYLSLHSNITLNYIHNSTLNTDRYGTSYSQEFGSNTLQIRGGITQFETYDEYQENTSFLHHLTKSLYVKYINNIIKSSIPNTRTSIDYSIEGYYTDHSDFLRNTLVEGVNVIVQSLYNNLKGMVSTTTKLENQKNKYYYRLEYTKDHINEVHKAGFNLKKNFEKFALSLQCSSSSLGDRSVIIGLSTNFGYNDKENRLYQSYHNNHNSGGVAVTPFEDINGNKVYDEDEKILKDSEVTLNDSSHNLHKASDGTSYSYSTRLYAENAIKGKVFSNGEYIYTPDAKSIGFYSRPNKFANVYFPYYTSKSICVLVRNEKGSAFSGIKLMVLNRQTGEKFYSISDLDGEVYFEGLVSGIYLIQLDPQQEKNTGFSLSPQSLEIDLTKEIESYGEEFVIKL